MRITPNPTIVHIIMRFAVDTLVGSPAAVMKITPATTSRIGATITAIVKIKSMILSISSANVPAPSGFGKLTT